MIKNIPNKLIFSERKNEILKFLSSNKIGYRRIEIIAHISYPYAKNRDIIDSIHQDIMSLYKLRLIYDYGRNYITRFKITKIGRKYMKAYLS